MKNTIKLYDGKAYGVEVSKYGIESGYLDYRALSKILDGCVMNNNLREQTNYDDWELVNGDYFQEDLNGDQIYKEVFQEYIISESGYEFLKEYTDEIVHYNRSLDIYLWGVTHYGTSWDYVLTDIKLEI